jgi:hypothetical protein
MPLPPSRYRWNAASARYIDASGRFVPRSFVRDELDLALEAAQQRMAALAESLRDGTVTLDDWIVEMRRAIKEVHLYSAAASRGGWAQMSQADYGRVGQLVREQYGYLENFANEIATGLVLDGRFLARVALYGSAGRRTFHKTERADMEQRAMDEERSLLNPADHCGECVAEAGKGWQPIGSLIPIGERTCKVNCKCDFEYRRAA